MNLNPEAVIKMTFVRCHRMGRAVSYPKRPILVRFLDYTNRNLIWNKIFDITYKSYSINENFANNIEHRRRLMYPIVKKAKQPPNYGKTYIKGDNLVVNNTTYNFDSLHKLPEDIHPKQFSYK